MGIQQDKTIVNLRFIALLLVVVGHSIILYSHYWSCFPVIHYPPLGDIKAFINVIQMPLFFAISGYLFNYSINKSNYSFSRFIKGKIVRLLLPFVCILIIYNDPIRFCLTQYDINNIGAVIKEHILFRNLYHLWYLPCLFGIFVIAVFVCKLTDWRYELLMFIVFTYLSVNPKSLLFIPNVLQINNIANYLIFFYTGYLVSKYNIVGLVKFPGIRSISLLLFLTILFIEVYYPSFLNTPLTIIACIIAFFMVGSKSYAIIELISINCLGIYLIHEPLCHIVFTYFSYLHPLIVSSINLFICGGIALLISYYIRMSRFSWLIGG